MVHAPELVFDLIFGRWRSQTLYAGAALGVFDQLSDQPTTAVSVAEKINAESAALKWSSACRSLAGLFWV
jgi:hypothetical protein